MEYLTKLDTGPNLGLNSGGSSFTELGPMTDPETGLPIETLSPTDAGSTIVTPIPGSQTSEIPAPVNPVNVATIVPAIQQNWPLWLAVAGLVVVMVSDSKTIRNAGIAAAGIGLAAQYFKNKSAVQPGPIPEPTA